jgi:hypothetical protein
MATFTNSHTSFCASNQNEQDAKKQEEDFYEMPPRIISDDCPTIDPLLSFTWCKVKNFPVIDQKNFKISPPTEDGTAECREIWGPKDKEKFDGHRATCIVEMEPAIRRVALVTFKYDGTNEVCTIGTILRYKDSPPVALRRLLLLAISAMPIPESWDDIPVKFESDQQFVPKGYCQKICFTVKDADNNKGKIKFLNAMGFTEVMQQVSPLGPPDDLPADEHALLAPPVTICRKGASTAELFKLATNTLKADHRQNKKI